MKDRALVRLSYVLGTLLVVIPLVDLVANLWPFVPDDINWRYGSYTLASGFLMTPVIGFAILVATGVWQDRPTASRTTAIVQWIIAVSLLAGTVFFLMDAIQLAATVPPEADAQFRIGVGKALFKNVVLAGVLVWLGSVAWRSASTGDRTTAPLIGATNEG